MVGLAQRAVPIHALTNGCYVVTANRVGSEGDLTFTGMSTIADPKGQVLAQAPQAGERIIRFEIDVRQARTKEITPRNNIMADRRPDQYALLTEHESG